MEVTTSNAAREVNETLAKRSISNSNIVIQQKNEMMKTDAELVSINAWPLPSAITVSCANAGGAPANAFIFNVDLLTPSATTDTYQDGFSGSVVSQVLSQTRQNVGAIIYGVTAEFTVTATGAALPSGLGTANPVWLQANTYGLSAPTNLNATVNHTRKDQATNVQVWRCRINMSRFTQFRITIPAAATCVLTFNTQPDFAI